MIQHPTRERDIDQTPVLIVGGGPVGVALAAELSRQGIHCLVVEKSEGAIDHPRASELNARTMEFCRRWGIADEVRRAGTPRDFPNAALFATSLAGHEIARIMRPGHAEDRPFPHGPERPKRCNQLWFNPILAAYVAARPGVELRMGCRFESYEEDADGIVAALRDVTTDAVTHVRAAYLVACCGGNSGIGDSIGARFDDQSILDHSVNIFFRAPGLWDRHDKGAASLNFFIDDEGVWGGMSAQDGRELWRLTVHGSRDGAARAAADVDFCLRRMFGGEFDYRILSVVPWVRRSWVADRFGTGRVFLAGDAAHQCSPTGGFGLNTGMGDAVDLAWKLAATLRGWAGKGLLASYEAERRPVALRNIAEATDNYHRYDLGSTVGVAEDSPEGAAVRARLGRLIRETRARQFLSEGIALGYRYDPSPICWPDGTDPTPDDVSKYVPSARPGGRAPHFWLAEGRSVLDLFGDEFVLLRLGATAPEAAPLLAAAKARSVPLRVETIVNPEANRLYERALVLIRPDGHVAWRADTPPPDPTALIDRLRGAG